VHLCHVPGVRSRQFEHMVERALLAEVIMYDFRRVLPCHAFWQETLGLRQRLIGTQDN